MNARDVDTIQRSAWDRKRKEGERTARLDALLDSGVPLAEAVKRVDA